MADESKFERCNTLRVLLAKAFILNWRRRLLNLRTVFRLPIASGSFNETPWKEYLSGSSVTHFSSVSSKEVAIADFSEIDKVDVGP